MTQTWSRLSVIPTIVTILFLVFISSLSAFAVSAIVFPSRDEMFFLAPDLGVEEDSFVTWDSCFLLRWETCMRLAFQMRAFSLKAKGTEAWARAPVP